MPEGLSTEIRISPQIFLARPPQRPPPACLSPPYTARFTRQTGILPCFCTDNAVFRPPDAPILPLSARRPAPDVTTTALFAPDNAGQAGIRPCFRIDNAVSACHHLRPACLAPGLRPVCTLPPAALPARTAPTGPARPLLGHPNTRHRREGPQQPVQAPIWPGPGRCTHRP